MRIVVACGVLGRARIVRVALVECHILLDAVAFDDA